MGWTKRWKRRLRALFQKDAVERELDEELAFHLEMATRNHLRAGMSPAEARRQAKLEFGGVERFKEEVRDARGLAWVSGMSLDFRLGARMLVKYPGLTVVGTLAITFAIWIGVGTFEFLSQVVFPTLPFEQGSRVVAIRSVDAERGRMRPAGLHDFAAWRGELRSVRELGAYRAVERNLITGDGRGEPIGVAEITASGFGVTRVPALLGRTLTAADEAPGALPVVVIGHDVWRRRFAGDPGVLRRTVLLGRQRATIVGVMPEGFGFPVAQSVWTPLRLDPLHYARGEEPRVEVFGRLAPGVSLKEAQAELAALGRRASADFAATHRHLRPRVMPYARSIISLPLALSVGVLSLNGFVIILLVLVCGNVALLMFARAATRESEIVVRSALGASRRRIVAQMFAEALVLSVLAGAAGLAGASFGLRWAMDSLIAELLDGMRLPFWFHSSLSPASIVYAVVLTVLAATIAGVVPALKMTGTALQGRLRESGSGGGGLRFGGLWTAVIVAQVAVTVVFPLITYFVQKDARKIEAQEDGFAAGQYLSARLGMDREPPDPAGDTTRAAYLARMNAARAELKRRLLEEPSVAGVTFASNIPRRYHGWNQVEMDGGAVVPVDTARGHRVGAAHIAPDYFEVLGRRMLSGRGFYASDIESGARVVIVNERFVDVVLGGKNPLGRRVRYVAGEGEASQETGRPWHEIVGVAPDLGMTSGYGVGGLYHPVPADGLHADYLVVRVRGEPEGFAPALQRLAAVVDPTLRLHDILPLDQVQASELEFLDFWLRITALLTLVVLVLSWAGIYAVMSFTVSRRTREIGIRVAMGADARRVVLAIFRRPLTQVALGVAAGAAVILLLRTGLSDPGHRPTAAEVAALLGYAAVMFAVCLLACIVPTRRALRIEPTEALRVE
ncbi:MAG TPA: ABC transporter permease [Longimicrobium sp.]